MIKRIKIWYQANQKRRAIASIRGHLLFFGLDTSDMTDEEIEQAVVNISKTIRQAGISAKTAESTFKKLAEIIASRPLNNECHRPTPDLIDITTIRDLPTRRFLRSEKEKTKE